MRSIVEGYQRWRISGEADTPPSRFARQSRVDRSPGAILGCRGQPNPTLPSRGGAEKVYQDVNVPYRAFSPAIYTSLTIP